MTRKLSKRSVRMMTITSCIAAGLVLAPAISASAAPAGDPSVGQHLRDWYASYDVPEGIYGPLVDKFLAGSPLDSMTEGQTPVSQRTIQRDGEAQTVYTYADGSISESGIEIPTTASASTRAVSPQSVSHCSSTTPSHYDTVYHNCVVDASNGVLDMSFHATYDIVQGNYNDLIKDVSTAYAYAQGGTAETPSLKITKQKEDASGPATATAKTQYSSSATSFTASLTLKVGSNTAKSAKGGAW